MSTSSVHSSLYENRKTQAARQKIHHKTKGSVPRLQISEMIIRISNEDTYYKFLEICELCGLTETEMLTRMCDLWEEIGDY